MKVYKIRHKPTGLFYQPLTNNTNLSIFGYVYFKMPVITYVGNGNCFEITDWQNETLNLGETSFGRCIVDLIEDDWEIITYDLVERREEK